MSKDFTEKKLDDARPRLALSERERMWQEIAARTASAHEASAPVSSVHFVLSPYLMHLRRYALVPLVIVLCVAVVSTTGTVAEAAKPGDTLFPVEQAIEQVQLSLATSAGKKTLEAKFATERLSELREIIDEEAVATNEVSYAMFATETPTGATFEAVTADMAAPADSFAMVSKMAVPVSDLVVEAFVFTDITVVVATQYGSKSSFTTSADTQDAVVEEVVARYGVASELVSSVTELIHEDRASRPSDRGDVIPTVAGEARVGAAASVLLDQLETVEDAAVRDTLLRELLKEISGVQTKRAAPGGSMNSFVQIDDDRIEVEYDGYKVRIDDDSNDDDRDTGGEGEDIDDDHSGSGRGGDDDRDGDNSGSTHE